MDDPFANLPPLDGQVTDTLPSDAISPANPIQATVPPLANLKTDIIYCTLASISTPINEGTTMDTFPGRGFLSMWGVIDQIPNRGSVNVAYTINGREGLADAIASWASKWSLT